MSEYWKCYNFMLEFHGSTSQSQVIYGQNLGISQPISWVTESLANAEKIIVVPKVSVK